jgi:hypothetical protein
VDDDGNSQEAHLWASTASYGDSFTLLYVDDVGKSQEAHLWASIACYGDSFNNINAKMHACYEITLSYRPAPRSEENYELHFNAKLLCRRVT